MASSVENMEQQILRIVASPQPYELKKALIQYCCKVSHQPMENEACHAVLKLAIQWMSFESNPLLIESGRMILMSWAQNKTTALVSFFDEGLLLSLVDEEDIQPSCVIDILICVFPYLKSSSPIYPRLCEVVGRRITTWLEINKTVQNCGSLSEFLISYPDCLPTEKEVLVKINHFLIQCLGETRTPKAPKDEMVNYFQKTCLICELLKSIWSKDSSQGLIILSVKQCFEFLSNPEFPSTVALASLTNHVPDDVINPMIYEVTTISSCATDDKLSCGLSKMVQWLVWPKKTKVVQWLLTFFKCLVKAGKKNVLETVILSSILQVLCRVYMPVIRENNFIILVNMLMNFLNSPLAFHMIIPYIPNLMDRLRNEKTEKSANYLKALGELMYTLTHKFPDQSGLYEQLLLCLKDIPKPSLEAMNKWLHAINGASVTEENASSPRIISPEMIVSSKGKRKTGLVNLGNTCYMNSILQCLLMLDAFRNALMSRRVSATHHPIMYCLQDVFTFLVMSKRDAVAPERFVLQSRPPWFPSRTQQDCCEFVQYMMDRLEEEDKSLLQDGNEPSNATNIIEENFKGVLCVTYKCLSCGNESKHRESFTDIMLSFPDKCSNGISSLGSQSPADILNENPKSLKGGDQIRKFQESVFTEESFESASNVETAPKPQAQKNTWAGLAPKRDPEHFTIHDLLDYLMKPEKLSGNNQYFCDQCRENVDGERHVQIGELPKYLMLTIKRFSFDVKSQTKPKLLHVVHYPEELTFSSSGGTIKLAQKDSSSEVRDIIAQEEWDDWAMDTSLLYSYRLCSVVIHSGQTCEAGHYYSYALDAKSKSDLENDRPQWYCFNDEYTYETSYKEFIEREKTMLTDTTYIVIYEQFAGASQAESSVRSEFSAPAEMIERVQLDNIKYFQGKYRLSGTSKEKKSGNNHSDDNDEDDSSPPPPGNCGSNGSNFSIPGNRFIF